MSQLLRAAITAAITALATFSVSTFPAPAEATTSDLNRLAILGDSLTTGYGVAPGQSYVDRLEAAAPGDNVLPLAHNGATVLRWLTTYKSELNQLRTWRPTTVLVALGANDYYIARSTADYAWTLKLLTAEIRSRVPGARVVFLHYYRMQITPDPRVCDVPGYCRPASPPPTWDEYGRAMAGEAARSAAGYLDVAGRLNWLNYLGADLAHLTGAGHYQYYLVVRDALTAVR